MMSVAAVTQILRERERERAVALDQRVGELVGARLDVRGGQRLHGVEVDRAVRRARRWRASPALASAGVRAGGACRPRRRGRPAPEPPRPTWSARPSTACSVVHFGVPGRGRGLAASCTSPPHFSTALTSLAGAGPGLSRLIGPAAIRTTIVSGGSPVERRPRPTLTSFSFQRSTPSTSIQRRPDRERHAPTCAAATSSAGVWSGNTSSVASGPRRHASRTGLRQPSILTSSSPCTRYAGLGSAIAASLELWITAQSGSPGRAGPRVSVTSPSRSVR